VTFLDLGVLRSHREPRPRLERVDDVIVEATAIALVERQDN
jgi:hypothetical protein